jgi:8-oxo-dGTP diphosphatase
MDSQHILVVAAIIKKGEKYLIARRLDDGSPDSLKWEFPGGKVEAGEDSEDALIREIREELGISIGNLKPFHTVSFSANSEKSGLKKKIRILAYLADWTDGEIELIGCKDARLAGIHEMDAFDFLDADRKIIKKLKKAV